MCGIAGIVDIKHRLIDHSIIRRMTDAMSHRGPDADGFFDDDSIGLGHRRLSIIDLSSAANQPFVDNSGRYVMVFNGEMYNYEEVKRQLTGYEFRTTGDTEALLAAYIKWGIDGLQLFRGMFAFAIWDRQEKEIIIARDRLGVKPLYYYVDGDRLLFASEVRSILASGLVDRKVDEAAMLEYLSYQSVSYPYSIIKGIRQLEAGTWLRIKNGRVQESKYWDLMGHRPDFDMSDEGKVKGEIRRLMLQSIRRRLVSDVPVGAFLSGGIDSSVVVGLMAEASSAPPNTFNISFEEKEYDESVYAEMIAKKFKTNHTKVLLKPTVFLDELENGLNAMDSPSGDGINTYVVSKAITQNGMRVALSGAGGDELFAGYPFFNQYLDIRQKGWLWNVPGGLRRGAAGLLAGGDGKRGRIGQMLKADSCNIEDMYPVFRQILSPGLIGRLTKLRRGDEMTAVQKILTERKNQLSRLPLLSQVSAAEYLGYTQHTLLKDTDQMSMAVSLEVREPFFDQDLIEFMLHVPDVWKKPVYPKSLLVESLKPLLPDEVVFRKKQGFLFPWNVWLRNELKEFCAARISRMAERSFIDGGALTDYWDRFLAGDVNVRWAEIWLFVVLEYWMEKNAVS